MVRTALRLNPLDTQNFHHFGELALATLMLGHHDRSVIEADNALARRPGYVYGQVFKISALWMIGENARAREAIAALLQGRPKFDPATLELLHFKDRSWNRRLRDTPRSEERHVGHERHRTCQSRLELAHLKHKKRT